MNTSPQSESKFPAGTLVFGLILIVIALASLSQTVFNWQFDTPLFFISLVALAGVAMIFSGIASARKAKLKNNDNFSSNNK
ncbi:hypothetical protein ACX5K5_11640 [Glutamicibacter bergerei]|jgi:uncharacterized integral membrane protein|uniref:Uncharacterized protein n=2 Tax=Glutamicibacter TaxID=1742989 RepID=A0ABV9MK96_9MICC|nr:MULTISPECIES: hypothetical protein [Glutamicibacter]PCC32553.1 hypothetical protein CIK74_14540 [Glutamicibacter sp. BW77]GGJ58398.1 hypothetical protein GCM10007173_16430 [Glutamicibacter ardleyensis]HBV08986.1 hypothetical protein [Micrococcaceae bacterium]